MQRWVALVVISTSSTSPDDEQASRSVHLAPIIARFRPPPSTRPGLFWSMPWPKAGKHQFRAGK